MDYREPTRILKSALEYEYSNELQYWQLKSQHNRIFVENLIRLCLDRPAGWLGEYLNVLL